MFSISQKNRKTNYIGVPIDYDFRMYCTTTKIRTAGYSLKDQKYRSMYLITKPDEDISMKKEKNKDYFVP